MGTCPGGPLPYRSPPRAVGEGRVFFFATLLVHSAGPSYRFSSLLPTDMEYAREDMVELAGGERGGVVQGYTPVHSHVQLYLVQIVLVIVLCFVLGQVVKQWNQPRVIAEVGGFVRWVARA